MRPAANGKGGLRPSLRFFGIGLLIVVATACGGGKNSSHSGSGATVTVSGVALYEDRIFDETGFTGTIGLPVRNVTVQVVRSSDDTVLDEGITAEDGTYTLSFTNTGPSGVYVSVLARDANGRVVIRDNKGAVYSADTVELGDSATDHLDVQTTIPVNNGGGIFNMLDVFQSGAEFVKTLTGEAPPLLTAVWSSGSCDGTFFVPILNSIHVLGGCGGDTDEYDDVVLLHEYGHFLASVYSRDDSPGGTHYLDDSGQDIRVAFSEGWGNFFPAAVRNDPVYMDTIGSVAAFSFNIEDLSSVFQDLSFLPVTSVYTTNEISVAAALWDVLDTSPQEPLLSGMDSVSEGMAPIWDVFSQFLPCDTCSISNVSFEDFWDGWFQLGHGQTAGMNQIAADREMALSPDGFEGDDDLVSATVIPTDGSAQVHTLYPFGDSDLMKFSGSAGTAYTVETLDLTNGADTLLEVLDSGGTALVSNDNGSGKIYSPSCGVNLITQLSSCPPNDPLALSSRIDFTPSIGGTYYIRVSRSPDAPPSAGEYGGYKVRVVVP
jgi:hypothetical protein